MRRAIKLRHGEVRKARRRAIFERDGWICGICGDPVNREAVVPELDAPTIDHIFPRSRGGSHDAANLQCAHFYCNSVKVDQVGFTAIAT